MKRILPALVLAAGLASFAPGCSKKAPPPKPVEPTTAPETKPAEPDVAAKVEDAAAKPEDAAAAPADAAAAPADAAKAEGDAAAPAGDVAAAAGDAAAPAPGDAAAAAGDAAAPVAITAEARVKKYLECWGYVNEKNWDGFKGCAAADMIDDSVDSGMPVAKGWDEFKATRLDVYQTAFPDFKGSAQMVFQVGDHTFGVFLFSGTHTGVLKSPMGDIPATNKKFGQLVLHHVQWQKDAELVTHQWFVNDTGTMMGQLGLSQEPHRPVIETGAAEPVIVIAKGDDAEKALVGNYNKEAEAFNKHDMAGTLQNLGEKFTWSERPIPADFTDRATLEGSIKGMWGAFSDLSLNPEWVGAAGNYVVATGKFKGTNDGENPAMKLPKTGKAVDIRYYEIQQYDNGKIINNWVFFNGMALPAQLGLLPPPPAPAPK